MYVIEGEKSANWKYPFRLTAMVRLEQITALVLAAGLAIPSYWFFWTLAGGGGYERRETQSLPMKEKSNHPNTLNQN